ncbi:MAG: YciI family protein [Acidimicrobiia bacterium]
MRYMLMICTDETYSPSPAEIRADAGFMGWVDELEGRGVLQGGERLRPGTDATTVRVREDAVLTSDGPFAETKEMVGGFNIVDCADLDEAIELAAKHPAARYGAIEVRPIWEL